MSKTSIAKIIALVATILSGIGLIQTYKYYNDSDVVAWLLLIGLALSIVSYCMVGFGTALKMAWKVGKAGWFVCPFPFDIITGAFTLLLGIYAVLFLPLVPVLVACKNKE